MDDTMNPGTEGDDQAPMTPPDAPAEGPAPAPEGDDNGMGGGEQPAGL